RARRSLHEQYDVPVSRLENGRFDEEARRQSGGPLSTGDKLGPFALSGFYVLFNRLELLCAHQRPHLDVRVESIAHFPLRNETSHTSDQLVGNRLLENRSTRGRASLPG